jgi:hypothetical protein
VGNRIQFGRLTGQRFGRLVLEGKAPSPKNDGRTWALFRCDCGAEVVKCLTKVKNGHTKSCGCLRESPNKPTPLKEMIGRRFGRLEVIGQGPTFVGKSVSGSPTNSTRWVCLCDCGAKKTILRGNLVNGTTRSCGCLSRERASAMGRHNWKGVGVISATFWSQVSLSVEQRDQKALVTHLDI